MTSSVEGEPLLLERWRQGDPEALRLLLQRYEKMVYNFVLNLSRCDRNTVYDITASSFVEAIQKISEANILFLVEAIRLAIEKCRQVKTIRFFDASDLEKYPLEKKETLRIVKEALFSLDFDTRVLLLLRDQANLPWDQIAGIFGRPVKDTKVQINLARVELRDKVAEILDRVRKSL